MSLAALAFAGPAAAASGQVTQVRFQGTFANAFWFSTTATSRTDTTVNASEAKQGSGLFVEQFTENFDANGNFTGATETIASVTSGFSFALHQSLASASLTGSSLPATTCTFDVNFNQIGCSATTIDVSVTWTGMGSITRGVTNEHFKSDGFSETDHFSGTSRDATATGTIGGITLSASDLQFADLGTTKSGTITVCIGSSC